MEMVLFLEPMFLQGNQGSTQTDFNGKYSIIAKSGQVLEVSYVGMKTHR
jgi:hypothetical protein